MLVWIFLLAITFVALSLFAQRIVCSVKRVPLPRLSLFKSVQVSSQPALVIQVCVFLCHAGVIKKIRAAWRNFQQLFRDTFSSPPRPCAIQMRGKPSESILNKQ